MEEDILLEEAAQILEEEEGVENENIEEDVIENLDSDSEFLESDNITSPLVIDQELIDGFQEYLDSRSAQDNFILSGAEPGEEEETETDYTEILENIYSMNVSQDTNIDTIREIVSDPFDKPFSDYTLSDSFSFLSFVMLFVIVFIKVFLRSV